MKCLVVLSHSLHVRNFVASGWLKELGSRGHEAWLLVPQGLIDSIRHVAQWPGVRAIEPVEPFRGSALRTFVRRRWRVASFVQRRRWQTYRHKIRLQMGSPSFAAQVMVFSALRRAGDLEAFWRRLERRLRPEPVARELIARIAPDVVFAPTLIHGERETELMKAAQAAGVPTVGFAASWDTLTSKGFFTVPPDTLLVWGEENRDQAIQHHGFAPERVVVTGAPHFDVYADDWPPAPRESFLAARGVPPEKRVLLFAGTTITYWEDEPHLLRMLSAAIGSGELKDCVVWYRPHPRRPLAQLGTVEGLAGVYVDDQALRHKREAVASYSAREADLGHYRDLLNAVDAVITAFSTMIIEAAMLGKGSLVVGFGGNDGRRARLIEHAGYEHSLAILATPGVTLCRSAGDLKREVQRVVSGEYGHHAGALRARARAIADNADGRARARILDALTRAAERRR